MAMTLDEYNQQYAAYGQQYIALQQAIGVPAWLDNMSIAMLKKATNDLYGKIDAWKVGFLTKYPAGTPENSIVIEWLDQQVTSSYKLTNPNTVLNLASVRSIRDTLNLTSVGDDSPFFSDIGLAITDIAPFVSACITPWANFVKYHADYEAKNTNIFNFQMTVEGFFSQAVTDGVIPPPTDMQYSYSFGNLLWKKFVGVANSGVFGTVTTIVMPGIPVVVNYNTVYPIPVLPALAPPPPPPDVPPVDAIAVVVPPPSIDASALETLMPPPETVDISNYVAPPVETITSVGEFDTTGIDMSPTPTSLAPVVTAEQELAPVVNPSAPLSWPDMIRKMTADATIKPDGVSSLIASKTSPVVMTTVMDSQNIIRGNAFVTPPDKPLVLTRVKVLMTPGAQDILVMMQTDDYRFGRIAVPEFQMTILKGKKGEVGPIDYTPIAITKKMMRGEFPDTQGTYFIFDNPAVLDVDSKYFWVIQAVAPQSVTTKTPVYDNVAQQLNTVVKTETTWPKLILHVAYEHPEDGSTVISRDGGQTWGSSSLSYAPWDLWGYYIDQPVANQINEDRFVATDGITQQSLMDSQSFSIPLNSSTPMPSLDLTIQHDAEPGVITNTSQVKNQLPQPLQPKSDGLIWGAAALAALLLLRR